jgi:hypothetical protein
MTDEERKRKIKELKDRLLDIPYSVQLSNFMWHMTHCDKCSSYCGWGAEVCEACGAELMEHGKH